MMTTEVKVRTRLAIAFGAVVILLLAVAAVGISRMALIDGGLRRITGANNPAVRHATGMLTAVYQVSVNVRNFVLLTDGGRIKHESEVFEAAVKRLESERDALAAQFAALPTTTQTEKDLLAKASALWPETRGVLEQVEAQALAGRGPEFYSHYDASASAKNGVVMRETLEELVNYEQKLSADEEAKALGVYGGARLFMLVLGGLAILLAVVAAALVMRSLLKQLGGEPSDVAAVANKVAAGDLTSVIKLRQGDSSSLLATMARMQGDVRERTERERAAAAENARIRVSLDKSSTSVMIADADGKIIYLNEAIVSLLQSRGGEIRKQVPQFDVGRLLGSRVAELAWLPAEQRNALASASAAYTADIAVGNARWRVTATPVTDGQGQRVGTAIQWLDRTEEVATEEEIQATVGKALDGDLTARVREEGKTGFFKALATGMNEIVGNMASVVRSISGAASEVRSGADEISRGNANLSQRTEEQASSLEETASSMEEMTSTVKNNADNASQANQLAAAARQQAERGGAVVQSAVVAMGAINASSRKINDIIGVIDEIAFQTNLLALNAAVEAARAGEQGRGFAVVASEVRNLASRSAQAAKEIKTLIQDSVVKVDEGTKLVDESGHVLSEIVTGVKRVTDVMGEIAASSQQQASGVEEVNKAIVAMDQVTQENAALVEQASAAAQALSEQAANLMQLIARYRLGDGAGPVVVSDQPTAVRRVEVDAALPAERRTAKRPWTRVTKPRVPRPSGSLAPVKAAQNAPAPGAPTAAASARAAGDWSEF
jgi:methyl-accepting chemotaxis protein